MDSTYSEDGPNGFTFFVSRDYWAFSKYIPGPDRRYNGHTLTIPDEKVDRYIQALKRNYQEYKKEKKQGKP